MLSSIDMPLAEVALSVGFQAQAHFSTVFKRLTGQSPARWRRAIRSERQLSNEFVYPEEELHSPTKGWRDGPVSSGGVRDLWRLELCRRATCTRAPIKATRLSFPRPSRDFGRSRDISSRANLHAQFLLMVLV